MAGVAYTEAERLNSVKRFRDFNFNLNKNLDGILQLATEIYETPVAFITLIDDQEQIFVVNRGFEVAKMPRATSFCTEAIKQQEVMVVSDAFEDDRFADNPLVKNVPNIRFYAGAPLATYEGLNIGTLCVMDVNQKEVSETKKQLLDVLAKQAIHLMELELTYKLLNEKMNQVELQNKALKDIAFIQSHEFRGPLSTIMGLMNIIKDEDYASPKEHLVVMEGYIAKLDEKIIKVVQSTEVAKSLYTA
ncbi:MAG: sensory histidine kinase AtoS [Flavipsychrobacter sp.]|jgi:GAF domain-containing protein|nr:sensory histidine kinase AtoS [Flavipsychrobacter sp.]